MVDRPVFAFETSFLDRLPQHYDRSLDPTDVDDDVMEAANNSETRDDEDRTMDEGNENDCEADYFHGKRPFPQRVPTSRVASAGSVNTSSSWYLRNKHHQPRPSKNSTCGGPSANSFFSIPAASLNSLNSLGSLSSLNSFLKGMNNSVESFKGINNMMNTSVDSLMLGESKDDVFSSLLDDAFKGPSSSAAALMRQVTPDEYRGRNRYQDGTSMATTSVMRTTTTTTKTTSTTTSAAHKLSPSSASAKSAAYLINLYSQQAKERDESKTVQQPVPPFLNDTTARTSTKAATPSVTSSKGKSKRIAAKKASKSKVSSTSTSTKKRIRRKEPVVRKYVTANAKDVLLGRGGGSNHHPGNIAYRQQILKLQPEYKMLDRDAKTAMSEQVVQWVLEERQGRFLKREGKSSPWYIVTDATARQKVSQALREDHTPEGRALKKSRTSYKAPAGGSKKKQSRN